MRVRNNFIFISATFILFLMACSLKAVPPEAMLDTPLHHVVNGKKLLKSGKIEAAYYEFNRAKELDSTYVPAHIGLGLVSAHRGDFANGFLEEMLIMGDGTVVIDDVSFGDSNSVELADIKFEELQRFSRQRFPTRNLDSNSAMFRVNSKKPLEAEDKLVLDIDTIGEVYIAGLFKNESTEVSPTSIKAKTPTPNRFEADSRIQPATGEQPAVQNLAVTTGNIPVEQVETTQRTGTVRARIREAFGL